MLAKHAAAESDVAITVFGRPSLQIFNWGMNDRDVNALPGSQRWGSKLKDNKLKRLIMEPWSR